MATAEEIAAGTRIRALITAAGGSTTPGGVGVPAAQLDADGVTLDVNVINDGEFLKRVGLTVVSGAPAAGLHHATHEAGGADQVSVAGLAGVLANPQPPIIGGGAAQAVAGNDARLGDARTPLAHKVSHQAGGGDELSVLGLHGLLADVQHPDIGAGAAQAVAGNDARLADARTPIAHAATHQPGGTDAMAVDAAAATGSLRTLGAGATQAVSGTDARLSDARTPVAHAASHAAAGADAVTITEGQVTNLLADLGAKALFGLLAGAYDIGTAVLLTNEYLFAYKRLVLSGAERLTVQGNSNMLVLDLGTRNGARLIGSPKTIDGGFTLPHENFFVQRKRLTLCNDARGSLLGTANFIVSDDTENRSRLTLAGRG